MSTTNDVHQQFAEYFNDTDIKPYLYALSYKMSEGHICIDIETLDQAILPDNYKNSMLHEDKLTQSELVTSGADYRPFVLHNNKFYLQRYFNYETILLKKMHEMIHASDEFVEQRKSALKDLQPFIQKLFSGNIATGPDWQLTAAIVAVLYNFVIITGGPGTGKTTTVAKILAILFSLYPDMKVALAAPTGKAAARMAESLVQANIDVPESIKTKFNSLQPATIHRLLGWKENSPFFKHNEENPLNYDLIIIDESSMIDVAMFAKLLQGIAKGSRIILLGDKDQLASVEAGSLFGDLCKSQTQLNMFTSGTRNYINEFIANASQKLNNEYDADNMNHALFQHIVELRYSHRFKDDQAIGKVSKAVIQNDELVLKAFLEDSNSVEVKIDQEYDNRIFESFISGYEAICKKENDFSEEAIKNAIVQLSSLRILCAVKEGEQGVVRLNNRVEAYLQKKRLIQLDHEFYEHRPVMITKNNYSLGLYNGDIGILKKDINDIMRAWFLNSSPNGEMELKSVLPGFISKMETVFAMTIHKSQGSEFDSVLVVLPMTDRQNILTRELLYTGITRAKKQVVIQSNAYTFVEACKAFVERGSGIIDRLDDSVSDFFA